MSNKQHIPAKAFDKRGRLLSTGENSYCKTHPLQARFAKTVGLDAKQYLHAEIHAIIQARGATIHSLHVSRMSKNGNLRNSKPCMVCQATIKTYGIKHVSMYITQRILDVLNN